MISALLKELDIFKQVLSLSTLIICQIQEAFTQRTDTTDIKHSTTEWKEWDSNLCPLPFSTTLAFSGR